ncbi:MAG TPA: tripartite tricarboxylate transporter substrate binding protein [Ramlibacter sp.]|nr:tripartite tricarboxylate transporter substrate binding protein [Ramlibacter sp.]
MRRTLRTLAAGLLASLCLAAAAADWPERPLRLLVPSTPGSTPDVFARILAEGLREQLGQPVAVENRPGAGGAVAINAVARAAPDGYTLGVSPPGPVGVNTLLYRKMPYDPATQLTLVSIGVTQANVVVARSSLGLRSVDDMLARLRREPGRHTYAAVGMGSINHLCMELIALTSRTSLTQVTYAGTPQALMALLAGEVDFGCLPAQAVAPHVRDGKLQALAVATARRSAFLPDIPTLKESGVSGIEAEAWMGLVAPAGVPPPVVQRLVRAMAQVLAQPEVRDKLAVQFMQPVASTPEEFAATVREDVRRWRPVIEARQIRLD